MSLELWSTIASTGTWLVITATAVAAIIQLRHLRASNQQQELLTILRMPLEPALREALDFTTREFPQKMQDFEFRKQLDTRLPPDRSIHKELWVCDYYERIGSCIKLGLFDEELYFDNSSPDRYWVVLEPAIAILRRQRGPVVYDNFEYLVVRCREWDAKHPRGNYPERVRRLAIGDPWLAADTAQGIRAN